MPEISEYIDIAAPRADVFRFCHHLPSWPEWDEQVAHVEMLTPKPLRRGTLLRVDASPNRGPVFSWDAEVVDYQLPTSSSLRALDTAASSPFAKGSVLSWQFSTVSGGTRFVWTWDYKPRGIIAKIMDWLGRRRATHQAIKQSLTNVKELIESGRRAGVN